LKSLGTRKLLFSWTEIIRIEINHCIVKQKIRKYF